MSKKGQAKRPQEEDDDEETFWDAKADAMEAICNLQEDTASDDDDMRLRPEDMKAAAMLVMEEDGESNTMAASVAAAQTQRIEDEGKHHATATIASMPNASDGNEPSATDEETGIPGTQSSGTGGNGTSGGHRFVPDVAPPTAPGAVAVGFDSSVADGSATVVIGDNGTSAGAPERTSDQTRDESILARASAVNDAEVVIFATSVSRDQTVKNRRIVICVGIMALLLIIGLATGLTLTKQGIGVDNTTTASNETEPEPDPRCVPPVQERDVFDLCHCGNSPADLNLTANETIMYENFQGILFLTEVIGENYTMDSCSVDNQCMVWAANYKRRNTTDELADLGLVDTDYLVQMHSLCLSYLHLQGRQWERSDNWLATDFFCEWFGVSCSFLSRVTGIQLQSNGLNGSFPTELQHMPFLRDLDVSRNPALRGTIPSELSHVVTLHTIDLSHTNMNGTIPPEIVGLDILDRLVLSNNSFTGTIPMSLTNSERMRELYLDHNRFSGTIHTEFGNLRRLAELSFGNNVLSGTLPTELAMVRHLEIFRVNDNRLNGTIPNEYRDSKSDIVDDDYDEDEGGKSKKDRTGWKYLEEINLSNNSFTGSFPTFLGDLPHLLTTLVHETNLTGSIPETFCEGNNKDRSIIILDCNTTLAPATTCSCCEKPGKVFCVQKLPDSLQDLA